MSRFRNKATRRIFLCLLGITKAISSAQVTLPGKWNDILNSVRISSHTAHLKLVEVDKDAAIEFYDLEEGFKRKIGRGKLYNKKDLDLAQKRVDKAFAKK